MSASYHATYKSLEIVFSHKIQFEFLHSNYVTLGTTVLPDNGAPKICFLKYELKTL